MKEAPVPMVHRCLYVMQEVETNTGDVALPTSGVPNKNL